MARPEAESFKQLTISVEKLPASMARQAEIDSYAADRARLLLGCYRTGDANDPETYVAAIAAVLSRFEQDTITAVTHPVSGIPGHIKWLPSVLEVREACERAELPKCNHLAREKRIQEQLAARKAEDESRERRPSYDELKAKYGLDWGIAQPKRPEPKPEDRAPTKEELAAHYVQYDLAFKPKQKPAVGAAHDDDLEFGDA